MFSFQDYEIIHNNIPYKVDQSLFIAYSKIFKSNSKRGSSFIVNDSFSSTLFEAFINCIHFPQNISNYYDKEELKKIFEKWECPKLLFTLELSMKQEEIMKKNFKIIFNSHDIYVNRWDFLQNASNYKNEFYNENILNLNHPEISISSFKDFISMIENPTFVPSPSNIFEIDELCYIFGVKIIENRISLIIKEIKKDISLLLNLIIKISHFSINFTKIENLLIENFSEIINLDNFFNLPLSLIIRIFQLSNQKIQFKENNQFFYNFLKKFHFQHYFFNYFINFDEIDFEELYKILKTVKKNSSFFKMVSKNYEKLYNDYLTKIDLHPIENNNNYFNIPFTKDIIVSKKLNVNITSDSLLSNSNPNYLKDHTKSMYQSLNQKNSSIIFDFLGIQILIKSYLIRPHPEKNPSYRQPRNWILSGSNSNDLDSFKLIIKHENDTNLQNYSTPIEYQCENNNIPYSFYKLTQFGTNSSNDNFFIMCTVDFNGFNFQ